MRRRAERALAELGAAAPLGAVCLLAANDHQFKHLFHNALTGKLSDVAICFLLPLLVSAALGLVLDWPGRRRLVLGAVVTIVVFTLLELSDTGGALFVRATGALGLGGGTPTRDPTDLLALACVPLAVAYGQRRLAAADRGPIVWRTATGAIVMVTGALALMACGYPCECPPDPCNKVPAPVTFQAEAGCGPGGLIVAGQKGPNYGFSISNAAALGLPPFEGSTVDGQWSRGAVPDQEGACPVRLDQGRWEVTVWVCSGSPCGQVLVQTCSAVLADGVGSVTCSRFDGLAPCTSRLVVVPP